MSASTLSLRDDGKYDVIWSVVRGIDGEMIEVDTAKVQLVEANYDNLIAEAFGHNPKEKPQLPGSQVLKMLDKLKDLHGVFGKGASEHLHLIASDLKRDRRAMLARRFDPRLIRLLIYGGLLRSLVPIIWHALLEVLAVEGIIRKILKK